MTTLLILVSAVLAINGALMAYLSWAFQSPRFAAHRMRQQTIRLKVSERVQNLNFNFNSLLSVGMVYAAIYFGFDVWFSEAEVSWWTFAFQFFAVLGLYDLAYYWVHRWTHQRRGAMKVHGVHHQALYPSARESLWIHPLETIVGITLLLSSTWLIGPLNIYAFACTFLVYTTTNVLIHSGINFPTYPLKLYNNVAQQHYGHHMLNMKRNYAPLTPIWDRLFGTSL